VRHRYRLMLLLIIQGLKQPRVYRMNLELEIWRIVYFVNIAKLLKMAKESKRKKKEKIKNDLNNCKSGCDNTCNRRIKDENPEVCVLKCQLACTNNALNQFIN
jgi:hypothetical protein